MDSYEHQELLPSGQQTLFSNRVAWAKTHLKGAGLILNPTRGKVSISEIGKQVLDQKPHMINCRFLKQFPSYLQFIGQATGPGGEEKGKEIIESTKTPLELLDDSFNTLLRAFGNNHKIHRFAGFSAHCFRTL